MRANTRRNSSKRGGASTKEADPLPQLRAVKAGAGFDLRVTWQDGSAETVDIAPVINSYRVFAPLRRNRALFRRVRLGDQGASVVWTDAIDMDAVTIARLARLTRHARMNASTFKLFLSHNRLTLDGAATAIGVSRRNIAYYASGKKPVPREVALACLGYTQALKAA
ncbi:MAG: DUF2442 domain-containing protein [Rhodospirillaceae bacterium]|nr:DUF2442 domain-containing protein [Rhodospirillaceae bacterium]